MRIVRGLSMIGQVVELCVLKATVGRLKDHNLQFLVIHAISLL